MIKRIEVSPEITLVARMGADSQPKLDGYTEILLVFKQFTTAHPEAEKFDDTSSFDPSPWLHPENTSLTHLRARPFLHVKNEEIPALLLRWEQQLEYLEKMRNPTV